MSRWNLAVRVSSGLAILELLVLAPQSPAQEILWSKNYGGGWQDGAYDITGTADGGFVVTGFNSSQNPNHLKDLYLLKTDAGGNGAWSKTFGGTLNLWGSEVRELPDGGFLVAGVYEVNPQTHDSYVIRTDASGNMMWQRWYDAGLGDDDRAHAICLTSDGGFIIAGQAWTFTPPFGSYDMYAVRCNSAGNPQWSRFYNWSSQDADVALSVREAPDGGFLFAGFTQSENWDAYVVRTDPLGNPIWQKTYGGDWGDEAYAMDLTDDGGFVLTGAFISNGMTDTDVGLTKVDADGNVQWERVYGGNDSDWGQDVRQVGDGGYLVAGHTASFGMGSWDGYVLRMSANGDLSWTTTFGGSSDDRAFAVEQTNDGDVIAAGWAWSFGAGLGDAHLILIDDGATVEVVEDGGLSDPSARRALLNVSPNPFRGSTRFDFTFPDASPADVWILDPAGRVVRTLRAGGPRSGSQSMTWDGRDEENRVVPPGIYFGTLRGGGQVVTRKLIRVP